MRPHITKCLPVLASLACLMAIGANAQTLTHRYSFNDPAGSETFADSVGGTNWDGSLANGDASLDGARLQLDGDGGYATLPTGITSNYNQMTVEVWFDMGPNNPTWTRIFSFGDQTGGGAKNSGVDYCSYAGGNYQNLDFSVPPNDAYANNNFGLDGTTNDHVTVVVDSVNGQLYYYNGVAVVSTENNPVPQLADINDQYNLLGRSLYDVDPTLFGSINEFRIYQGVLPASRVALNDASGPDNYVTTPGALQSLSLTAPVNPLALGQVSQQSFLGNFANVTNLNLIAYGGASFTSGNSSVLTIDPTNGTVTPVGGGSTTIIASYGGMSATNTVIISASPAALTHRYSFTTDASDSVGHADGTIVGDSNIVSGQVILDGNGTYVSLPGDAINVATNTALTLETWVTFTTGQTWARLFEFGDGMGGPDIYSAPQIGENAATGHRSVSENIGPGSQTIDSGKPTWTNMTLHITTVFNPLSGILASYTNGVLEYALYNATAPLSATPTNVVWLGHSPFSADPYLMGSIDEFRIYSGALTPQEIALTDRNGPNSTNREPGALASIQVSPATYPAYAGLIPPVISATYANLTNFDLLPNNTAAASGLVVTSSDSNVVEVLPNNMIRTFAPGTATLTALYGGQSSSATVTVANRALLTHRYSFSNDVSDSVGGADGVTNGNATVTGGMLVLDGTDGTYASLPPGLIDGYNAVTVDTWATFNNPGTWSRLWFFGDNQANEYYMAPVTIGGSDHRYSTGFPINGINFDIPPPFNTNSLHITCILGDGSFEIWTNGVLDTSSENSLATAEQVGTAFSWIGRSPYNDPYCAVSVDEFRIYNGRLSPSEIMASDILGPNATLGTNASLKATASAGEIVLSFPVADAGFTLQEKSSLTTGMWMDVTNSSSLVNSNTYEITVPATGTAEFFRLVR